MYYLKYRPKNFKELEGLEDVAKALQNALTKKQISHAYIFTGPKGSGKTTTARILAKALNCENLGKDGEPCNKCASCVAVNEGKFLDLIEIDAASNRGIDDVRDLREKIKLTPSMGRYKVYIIDEVHMLTNEAFNAFLKTLEEPPVHAVFILATTEYQKIPDTIKSRCQVLRFKRGKKADLIKKLSLICEKEGVKVSPEDLARIAELSEGGYRNAETLLEQVVVGEISLDQFAFSPSTFISLLADTKQKEALEFIDLLARDGESISAFSGSLISYLRDLLLILGDVGDDILDMGEDSFQKAKKQADKLGKDQIIYFINRFLEAEERSKFSPIPQLPLELAVFDAASHFTNKNSQGKPESMGRDLEGRGSGEDKEPENEVQEVDTADDSPKSPNAGPRAPGGNIKLTLAEVSKKWDEVLKAVKPYNHSLEALLRSCRPKEVSAEGVLFIEVFYRFHKDRLSAISNADILRNVLNAVFGCAPVISYVLVEKERELAAVAGSSASSEDIVSAALEAFGA